jgi:hypothetical protein
MSWKKVSKYLSFKRKKKPELSKVVYDLSVNLIIQVDIPVDTSETIFAHQIEDHVKYRLARSLYEEFYGDLKEPLYKLKKLLMYLPEHSHRVGLIKAWDELWELVKYEETEEQRNSTIQDKSDTRSKRNLSSL